MEIHGQEVCDTSKQCPDNSDEEGCGYFTCPEGKEWPRLFECSGIANCANGSSDGANCSSVTRFKCPEDNEMNEPRRNEPYGKLK